MRIFPVFLLILASGTAIATTTQFSLAPGDQGTYFVTGSEPTVHVTQGDARVGPPIRVGSTAWLITIECLASSSTRCEGAIES